jgi:hypothetical protein
MDSELAERVYDGIANAVMLEGATQTIAGSQFLSDAVRTTWRACARDLPLRVGDFRIEGILEDGAPAAAYRIKGRLDCDEPLRRRAEIIVAMREQFALEGVETKFEAILDGDPVAVALTLTRAMTVVSFEMRLTDKVLIQKRNGSIQLSPIASSVADQDAQNHPLRDRKHE